MLAFTFFVAGVSAASNAFTYPSESATVNIGDSLEIKWTNTSGSTAELILRTGDSDDLETVQTIASNITNAGSYNWTVPSNISAGSYTIEIEADDEENYSPYFNITTSNTSTSTTSSSASESSTSLKSTISSKHKSATSGSSVATSKSKSSSVVSSLPVAVSSKPGSVSSQSAQSFSSQLKVSSPSQPSVAAWNTDSHSAMSQPVQASQMAMSSFVMSQQSQQATPSAVGFSQNLGAQEQSTFENNMQSFAATPQAVQNSGMEFSSSFKNSSPKETSLDAPIQKRAATTTTSTSTSTSTSTASSSDSTNAAIGQTWRPSVAGAAVAAAVLAII